MLDEELHVYRVKYGAKAMDMSGGDAVDGPRWTGGYVDYEQTALIIAPTKDFAAAYAVSVFGERDGGTVVTDIEDLGECAGIVNLIGRTGERPSIVRPFKVEATEEDG